MYVDYAQALNELLINSASHVLEDDEVSTLHIPQKNTVRIEYIYDINKCSAMPITL
jgi:hypothetical protein